MSEQEFKRLTRKRGAVKHKLTSFIAFFDPILTTFEQKQEISGKTLFELQSRVDKIESILSDFEEVQLEIELVCSDEDLPNHYTERDNFTTSHSKYVSYAKYMLEILGSTTNEVVNVQEIIIDNSNGNENPNSSQNSNEIQSVEQNQVSQVVSQGQVQGQVDSLRNIKLPTITLPTFKGDFDSWLDFKDMFESLIHTNDSLSSIQKFHYLRATLVNDALKIIQSLEFSAQNYNNAWGLLCSRFDNSRLLINNHIKALFNIESLNKESANCLRNLIDSFNKHLRALKTMKLPVDHWDALIIYIISSKLDKNTNREWEKQKSEKSLPTYNDLQTFLKNRADFLETLDVNHITKEVKEKEIRKGTKHLSLLSSNSSEIKCNFCNQNHLIYKCTKFLELTISQRWEKVKELKLCSNCLCKGHFSTTCHAGVCRKCHKKHSTILHQDKQVNSDEPKQITSDQTTESTSALHVLSFEKENSFPNDLSNKECSNQTPQSQDISIQSNLQSVSLSNQNQTNYVILATAVVYVRDLSGKSHKVKAVLDSGSQSCFISEQLSKKLKLQLFDANISISGITNGTSNLRSKCNVTINSMYNNSSFTITCFILPRITNNLPIYNFDVSSWKIPSDLQLADPSFNVSSNIDLLIGASLFWELLLDGKISLGKNGPILQNTVFGYIVSGQLYNAVSNVQCLFTTNQGLHDDLKNFWLIEESNHNSVLSEDDLLCEKHFTEHVSRNNDGKFVVKIPLKHPPSVLGESKDVAIKRLLYLERRFTSNSEFKKQYVSFMDEYKKLGHMSLVQNIDDSKVSYFLPHHGVIREESLTTKLRVVFDGSSVTKSGKSLNDIQFTGPAIQNDIFDILLRFRQHAIVVTADIAKMYRQILVHPDDRSLQRIVWRDDPKKDIKIFELNTVTYGTASAPYLAIRCIKQLAIDNQNKFPISSNIILKDIFVDDLITGFDCENTAIHFCKEISNILLSATFQLRKWNSNSLSVLESLKDNSDDMSVLNLGDNDQIKTLGIQWSSKMDTLSYQVAKFSHQTITTKRSILSDIAKIFDPLGLVSPCTILVKIMIQNLWLLKIDWDDNVPPELEQQWLYFRHSLDLINELKIPRYVFCPNPINIELHGFCDASQKAYSACVYLRSINSQNDIQVTLLCAKTKVAPLKVLTIPRLELCGALMLARLMKVVTDALTSQLKCFLWCDSQIVLHWLNTESKLLQTFVGNRVSEIQSISNVCAWNYIPTKENPADSASRGLFPKDLITCHLWWGGPSFLSGNSKWPEPFKLSSSIQPLELRKQCKVLTVTHDLSIFNKYSSLKKLIRVHAYCQRFISNARKPDLRQSGPLTVQELNSSLHNLVKLAQLESFSTEISILRSNSDLKSKHRLLSLSPFIDSDGLLRVGGRLKHAHLAYDTKHPLLLDGKHLLTRLIFEHEHTRLLHAGPQLLLATVRQTYWPTSGMRVAKITVKKCVRCFKFNPKQITAKMSNLPEPRVTISSPFSVTGVDYAGPFTLKDRKGRGAKQLKAYICLFICFSSKAIHLELVTDLTTDSFLSTLRRFSARRGKPCHMYSDNGLNFVGAQKELKFLYDFLLNSKDELIQQLANENIVWHFIPPNSPNFGGLWESNIKGVKHHLSRVIGQAVLTYEEFSTVLVQIEATLNSRPMYPLSSDPNDMEPLTPSHFLIGKPLVTLPDPDYQDVPQNRLTRLQLVQQINQGFWNQWSRFYLSHLQQRVKWQQKSSNVEIGTLVLIKHDNLPPCKWLLGRIQNIHPGDDGIVRVVTIKTATGTLKRAVSKICPLPCPDQNNEC